MSDEIENPDMVNHPPHYTKGDVECIEAIKASMTSEEYIGFLKGQVIKYVWRFEDKWDAVEDLKKAEFYLDKLQTLVESNPDIFRKDFRLTVKPSGVFHTEKIDLPKNHI